MTADIQQQIACVRREIGMRERVYPSWVSKKKMSQSVMDYELATMRDVLATLERVQKGQNVSVDPRA